MDSYTARCNHEAMDTKPEEIKGNEEAARYVGVSVNTWRPYVARHQAPAPDRREISGGHAIPVWKRSTLDEWMANRPGPGARTDLRRAKPAE